MVPLDCDDPLTMFRMCSLSSFQSTDPVAFRIWEENKVFHRLTLTIPEVSPHFLDVPIRCHALSPAEQKSGVLWLQEGGTCYVV